MVSIDFIWVLNPKYNELKWSEYYISYIVNGFQDIESKTNLVTMPKEQPNKTVPF